MIKTSFTCTQTYIFLLLTLRNLHDALYFTQATLINARKSFTVALKRRNIFQPYPELKCTCARLKDRNIIHFVRIPPQYTREYGNYAFVPSFFDYVLRLWEKPFRNLSLHINCIGYNQKYIEGYGENSLLGGNCIDIESIKRRASFLCLCGCKSASARFEKTFRTTRPVVDETSISDSLILDILL